MLTNPARPPFDVRELRQGLPFFSQLEVVEQTGSTNADLLARAGDPAADRIALLAEEQVQGRGRHARSWASPPRAQLSLSMLLRLPGIAPGQLGWLPLLTGVAVVDAVRAVAAVDANLKWPNDVLIGDRKVAGILAEVAPGGAVVVGVGLNVSLTEAELPVPHATSLLLAGAASTDRTALAGAVLRHFAARFTAWQQAGWAPVELAADYRERCATLGTQVRAELPGGVVLTGVARDVDAEGRLLIGDTAVAAGDVTHVRPE